MAKEKQERVAFDAATRAWFRNNLGAQTTVMRCERCGLYYKPSLGHKDSHCKIRHPKESEYDVLENMV